MRRIRGFKSFHAVSLPIVLRHMEASYFHANSYESRIITQTA